MAVFACQYYITADVPYASSPGGIMFLGFPGVKLWKGNISAEQHLSNQNSHLRNTRAICHLHLPALPSCISVTEVWWLDGA